MRDHSKSKVYAAETAVFDHTLYREQIGMAGVSDLADRLFNDQWWVTNIRLVPELVATRREADHSWAAVGGPLATISMSLDCEDAATFAHEAAHVATYVVCGHVEGHGPEFRSALIEVVRLVCGPPASDRLAAAFSDYHLAVAADVVPAAPVRHERGIYGMWRIDRFSAR